MLHTLHKSLSADRRDWKLFNYYSLRHFLGVKSARIRAQVQVSPGGATGSYWPLVASSSPRPTHRHHQLLGYSPHLFCLSKLNVVSSTRAGGVIIYLPSRKLPRSAHINTSAAAAGVTAAPLWTTQHSASIISVCICLHKILR